MSTFWFLLLLKKMDFLYRLIKNRCFFNQFLKKYLLSMTIKNILHVINERRLMEIFQKNIVSSARLERAACCLGGNRSIHLSYENIII